MMAAHHDQLKRWLVDDGLTVKKAGELLARQGMVVPERTLHVTPWRCSAWAAARSVDGPRR